jgi:transferase family hexapeptide repeat protein
MCSVDIRADERSLFLAVHPSSLQVDREPPSVGFSACQYEIGGSSDRDPRDDPVKPADELENRDQIARLHANELSFNFLPTDGRLTSSPFLGSESAVPELAYRPAGNADLMRSGAAVHIRDRIKQIGGLSLLAEARWLIDRRVRGKLLLSRGAVLQMDKTASLEVRRGSFNLNRKWNSADPGQSSVFLGARSRLIIDDNFAVYTGARIYVWDDAVLYFGGGYANHDLRLDCYCSVHIGKNVSIAPGVVIRDSDNKSVEGRPSGHAPITIGENVWIGMNAIILKGVTIGAGSIVAAGSVVIADVPEKCLAAGNPARVVRTGVSWSDGMHFGPGQAVDFAGRSGEN